MLERIARECLVIGSLANVSTDTPRILYSYYLPTMAGMGTVLRPSTTGKEVSNPLGPLRECPQPQPREVGRGVFAFVTLSTRLWSSPWTVKTHTRHPNPKT